MSRICAVPHCGNPASSEFSPHCRRHKSMLRRQGAVGQTGIGKGELNPYLDRVRARVDRNADSPLWPALETSWAAIVSDANRVAEKRVGNRYERSAAHEILNIDADAPVREIVVTALAMFLMWRERPGRFADDRAFRMQLARRVRALSTRHRGSRFDPSSGRQQAIYREMTPKAGAILGEKLALAFGFTGIQLAELEKRDRQSAEEAKQTIINAIKELK
ncbi:hypothetical protein J5N58_12215 [Rhizobium cremeum]|uniref:hypothetical protein n=1 Tax=Rhizobium cremeum TaxID=2813827 RepID=UPI000DDFFDA9|nr:hypothetical protein [Rhizobium cremeum]MCJ7995248.1 hypothetical protein [Rhizobium cremeum]MCJ8000440.1 hypothetical protein [Rhizobium cremeum]